MKTTKMLTICVMALGLMVFPAKPAGAAPMGTAFTYQGHLYDNNDVADGLYDFQFKLFDDPNVVLGNQVGGDVNKPDVDVIDGYFTVELDFGGDPNAFNGEARWLEIGVRPGDINDPNVYTTLEPRQEITPTPYAFHTRWLKVDTALDNIFAGKGAGISNTTGYYNSAMGYQALYSNTTGYRNSAMGPQALQDNTTGYFNSAMGNRALYSNSTGFFNTAMGSSALYDNTTGAHNSAVGLNALGNNTTGNENSALGNFANFYNQGGSKNTIIGYEAGRGTSAHSKSRNVFIGFQAGYYETGSNKLYIESSSSSSPLIYGEFNNDIVAINGSLGIGTTSPTEALDVNGTAKADAFVGDGSGLTNLPIITDADWIISTNDIYSGVSGNVGIGTTSPQEKLDVDGPINTDSVYKIAGDTVLSIPGTQNIFVGRDAGYNNTTGSTNIFLGYHAGYSNTEGSVNTFLGNYAGYFNTEGFLNTFLGNYAGHSNTTGNYNTFLGNHAGLNNTEGNWNTFLGCRAGYSNTKGVSNTFLGFRAGSSNTEGSGNVFIGYKAGYDETGSNKLYIANSDVNNLIYGDFSDGKVGIGTTSPTEELEVEGNAKVTGDLTVDGTINGGINGGIKQLVADFVVAAGESVTAGDVVSFLDGYVQKGFVAGSPGGDSITYGPEAVFSSESTEFISAAALSDTKFVLAYSYTSDVSRPGVAVIGQVSGSDITYGTGYEFSDNIFEISVAALSENKFVLVYQYVMGYAQIGEVSGNTITYGTATLFNSDPYSISAASLTDSKFVVAYGDFGNSSYGTCVIGDVSGNTISYGSEYVFNSYQTYEISVAALSTTKFVIAYETYPDTYYGAAKVGEVSGGTNITYGPEKDFNSGNTYRNSAAALSDSKFVVAYRDDGNSDYGTAVIGNVSGSAITFGPEFVFNSYTTHTLSVAGFSADRFVVVYDDLISNKGIARIGQVSGYTITYGSVYGFHNVVAGYISTAALSDSKFVVAYRDWTARIGDSPVDLGDAVVGIAGDSKTAGQTVPVIIGGISDVHSGLTAGTVYYAAESGDLTTSANNYRVGLAISGTEILLNSNQDTEDQFFGDMIFANNFRITEASAYEGLIFKNQLGSEILNITGQGNLNIRSMMRLEPGSAPASPLAGDLYFDSADNKLKCYDGTTWQACF